MTGITDYGYNGSMNLMGGAIPARVITVHKDRFGLICENGECYAHLRRGMEFSDIPTVGDFVALSYNPIGDGIIDALLPRKTAFLRYDSFNARSQAVAANFDYAFIVTSLNRDLNVRRLERYLSQAVESGAEPVVVITKIDLAMESMDILENVRAVSGKHAVIAISSVTGEGLDELAKYFMPGKTIALMGSSGVGKSTLVNALEGEEVMKVNGIREDDAHGRHTTTYRRLLLLKSGAMIIDTPGMRELGVWDAEDGVKGTFSDIEELAGRCRFRDCSHNREPGCAVREALENGEIDVKRLDSYLKLKHEAARTAARAEKLRRAAGVKRR